VVPGSAKPEVTEVLADRDLSEADCSHGRNRPRRPDRLRLRRPTQVHLHRLADQTGLFTPGQSGILNLVVTGTTGHFLNSQWDRTKQ
jgi:hypothetical protein